MIQTNEHAARFVEGEISLEVRRGKNMRRYTAVVREEKPIGVDSKIHAWTETTLKGRDRDLMKKIIGGDEDAARELIAILYRPANEED